MKLEAVTVSVGYADFLAVSAQHNAAIFDRWLIVTSEKDEATRHVCRKYSLECLLSEDHKLKGASFSKGRLVERGLQHLSLDGWRLHIDADIILPARTKKCLDMAQLDETCIYGADRVMVRSWDEWKRLLASGWLNLNHSFHCNINPPHGFHIGTRWASPRCGFVPIGAFQLFHSSQDQWSGIRQRQYPADHGDACRTDIQFGLTFDRNKRVLLPELIIVHLESENARNGANWNGRTTKQFGPSGAAPSGTEAVS